jgi:hypothetical protein
LFFERSFDICRESRLTEKPCTNSSCYTYPTLPVREFYDFNAPVSSAIDDREYAVPDTNFYSTFSGKHPCHSPQSIRASTTNSTSLNSYRTLKSMPLYCIHPTMACQAVLPTTMFDYVSDSVSIEAPCGNNLFVSTGQISSVPIKQLNNNDLVVREKVADGLFGCIHLANMKSTLADHTSDERLVIVKSLHENVPDQQK